MLPRFLVSDLDPSSGMAVFDPGEAHHLTRVLRLGVGDEVSVFDGRGREFRARVDRVGGVVVARLLDPIEPPPARQVSLTLAQAVLKGASMDDVVRDATMMGVARIVPLVTERTVARRAASSHGADRWRRVAIASAKQCRRAIVPEVAEPVAFDAWRREPREGVTLLLVEPSLAGVTPVPLRALSSRPQPGAATLVVGPEGGWAPDEVDAAAASDWLAVTLGPLTLRAEAVPLAALAALTVVWD